MSPFYGDYAQIDQIDVLTAKYSNKEQVINRYLDFFRIRVKKQLESMDKELREMGSTFLSDIERLYGYLVQLSGMTQGAFLCVLSGLVLCSD